MGRLLYRRIDDHTFATFDPATNEYAVVPADRVPPLALAAERVRPTAAEARADPGYRLRQLALLAMLDLQEQATATGDATAAVANLLALARLPEMPPDVLKHVGLPHGVLPIIQRGTATGGPARTDLTAILRTGATPTAADLVELVMLLPKLPIAKLRKARVLLDAAWGSATFRTAGVIDRLASWAEQHVASLPPLPSESARMSLPAGGKRPVGTYKRL